MKKRQWFQTYLLLFALLLHYFILYFGKWDNQKWEMLLEYEIIFFCVMCSGIFRLPQRAIFAVMYENSHSSRHLHVQSKEV